MTLTAGAHRSLRSARATGCRRHRQGLPRPQHRSRCDRPRDRSHGPIERSAHASRHAV